MVRSSLVEIVRMGMPRLRAANAQSAHKAHTTITLVFGSVGSSFETKDSSGGAAWVFAGAFDGAIAGAFASARRSGPSPFALCAPSSLVTWPTSWAMPMFTPLCTSIIRQYPNARSLQ